MKLIFFVRSEDGGYVKIAMRREMAIAIAQLARAAGGGSPVPARREILPYPRRRKR